jgi:hypothetical protein
LIGPNLDALPVAEKLIEPSSLIPETPFLFKKQYQNTVFFVFFICRGIDFCFLFAYIWSGKRGGNRYVLRP